MDETTFRILDTLSRGLGRPISINEMTKEIKERYGTAFYANIYERTRTLTKQGIIGIARTGKSSNAFLNFKSYLTIDLLTEMELRKKQEFLGNKTGLQMLFLELETYCSDLPLIKSMSLINAERNERLNRAELLILLRSSGGSEIENGILALGKILSSLQRIHNIKIDYLILTREGFLDLLRSDEINPLKEMISNQITFLLPQAFWIEIRSILERGIQLTFSNAETNPAKIHEHELEYNLARFGYKEIGHETREGQKIGIEYVATSILMKDDARRKDAIPIILAKSKTNYATLIFLAQKYGLLDRLLGLLKALHKIKPATELHRAIRILEAMDVKEIRVNEKTIVAKMRLYNAIG